MATGLRNRERVPENLKKQLALAVRTIQWSYGIFWSISDKQPGVLEWGDGYYNGDIKTRKTVQSIEFNADQMDFQRSEQLKELYESLSAGEANPQARRPSAALSPEDLTDLEWYYLVCMSFVFNIGQGLPGRTLATGQPIWLRNAHYADSKLFSRSLLAKSVSIQTVVCFPYSGGVIELGVTEMVVEDPSLIQLVKNSYLGIPYPAGSMKSNSKDAAADHDIFDGQLITVVGCEELEMVSPENSSSDFEANQLQEDSFLNGGASQVQSWQFMDDEFSNCLHTSMNSSDCISQSFMDPDKVVSASKGGKISHYRLPDLQECKHEELASVDDHLNDDLHFHSVLSSLLKSSHHLILGPHFRNSNKETSFVSWKRVGLVSEVKSRSGTSQKLLKKVLLEVPRMHDGGLVESPGDEDNKDEIGVNHVISEKKKEKLDERFIILKTLVPSISKGLYMQVDKVSILDTTIEYLKELEKRVEELEPCRELTDSVGRAKRKPQDSAERISDNYGHNKTGSSSKRGLSNKRKASETDSVEPEISYVAVPNDNLTVSVNDKDVLIELRCSWREGMLLEVMDAVSNLRLDSHSVQTTTNDGILSLTIKSKVKGSAASARMIRQALHRFIV